MLKMSRPLSVFCLDSPTVRHCLDISRTHVYHRLYGYYHTCHKSDAVTSLAIVWNFWIFVQVFAHTVTNELSYNGVAVVLIVFLNRRTQVAKSNARLYHIYCKIQTFFGGLHQSLCLRGNLAYSKGLAGISVIAVNVSTNVY